MCAGCSHSGTDFFPAGPACAACTGLPEEVRLTRAALAARLLVLAPSSADRDRARCWWPHTDGPRVAAALAALLPRERAATLPLFAFGASSGGGFVSQLPHYVPHISAIQVQIMGSLQDALTTPLPAGHGAYPPSRWEHMPRDAGMAAYVAGALEVLHRSGSAAEEATLAPLRVTPDFLSGRIEGMSPETSAAVAAALSAAGLLDAQGFLKADPRRSAWRDALAPLAPQLGADTLAADASPIAEELNVAYAKHELSADGADAMLAFFARHARPRGAAAA